MRCHALLATAVVISLAGVPARAEIEPPEPLLEGWRWVEFGPAQGLTGEVVRDVREASDGTPWAATEAGLFHFDGFRWRPAAGLPAGDVRSIAAIDSGLLATVDGRLYRGDARGFEQVTEEGLAGVAFVHVVAVADGGAIATVERSAVEHQLIWIRADGVTPIAPPVVLGPDQNVALKDAGDGRPVLYSTTGLYRWSGERFVHHLPLPGPAVVFTASENASGDGVAGVLFPFDQIGVWEWAAGRAPRLNAEEARGHLHVSLVDPSGDAIAVFDTGQVRVRRGGVWRSLVQMPESFKRARGLRAAASGNIWVIGSKGLHLLRGEFGRWRRARHAYPEVDRNRIHEIVPGEDGRFWVATAAGVDLYDRDLNARALPFPEGPLPNVTALVRDRHGRLWAGSGSGFLGLRRWNGRDWAVVERDLDGEAIGFIHKARRDRDDRMWFLGLSSEPHAPHSLSGGVWTSQGDVLERWAPSVALAGRRFYDVAVAEDGVVWFATSHGVERWDGQAWRAWRGPYGSPTHRVFRLALDGDGGVWAASQVYGLAHIDAAGRAREVEVPGGQLGREVWDLRQDDDGRLWLASNSGLACLHAGEWTTLGTEAGLEERKVWPLEVADERLYVGTRGGGLYVLDLTEASAPAPEVEVTLVEADVGRLHLHWQVFPWWGQPAPEVVETRHRLDGGDWSPWSTARELDLSGLTARRPQVEVQARSLFGRIGRSEVTTATLPLPLHRSPSFFLPLIGLAVALAATGLFAAIRRRRDAARLLRVEGEVANSRQALAAILDGLPDAFAAFDRDRRFTYLNAAALRLSKRLGLGAASMLGRDVREIFPTVVEEGSLIERVVREQAAVETELYFEPLGLWFAVRLFPAADGVYAHAQDVTERHRQAEFERKLLDAQRLESLGVLAGGVAHDFNNLLTAIIGNAEVALAGLAVDGAAAESLREVTKAARRAADLTEQMLAYAGRGSFVRESVELGRLVAEMVDLLRVSLGKGVELELDLASDLPPVDGDAAGLRQVVMNLIVNAAEAIGDRGGTIRVTTARSTERADAVELQVSDDGPGVDAAIRDRLFDPFVTTKFAGRGLGLAAVQGIVESHGGTIDVTSAVGEGARFRVSLPRVAEAERAESDPVEPALAAPPGASLLVVDDQPEVRGVVEAIVRSLGFEPLPAASAKEALARFDASDGVAAALVDVTMPDGSGVTLAEALRRRDRDIAVVLMSGYDIDELARDGSADAFLQKPFTAPELRAALARALAG